MLTPLNDDEFPPPAHIVYDPEMRQHTQLGEVVSQPATTTQRAMAFAAREDEWEAFCAAVNKLPGMIALNEELRNRTK